MRSFRSAGVATVFAVLATACAAAPTVEVEEANRSSGPLQPDGQASFPDTAPGPGQDDGVTDAPAPETSIVWGACDTFGIPERVVEASSGWECGRLTVDMDSYGSGGITGLPPVELALTRHRATGARRGSILLNPGGPGAAGLPTAWGVRQGMPTDMLRGFDIVSWDPRGIGQSTPRISCDGADSFADDFIERCAAATGELSGFVSAPYNAADMEEIRKALGEDRLNYLGFSYGSILGATYAQRFTDSVGAFVLDGVTSPLAGSAAGPFNDGFASFADDGREDALDRLLELCDATDRCLPDRSASDVLDDVSDRIDQLATDDFAGNPEQVDSEAFSRFLDGALTYAGDWELLATALDDAHADDASALASLIADDQALADEGDAEGDEQVDEPGDEPTDDGSFPDNFADANFVIYCADFGPLITRWSFCDALPTNVEVLAPVADVDLETPMLIIGTEYDPLTPGKHAPEFAEAVGDATHMIWEGVGHTAFPGWTDCIDDAVAAQFLGGTVPADGTRCSMIEGIADDVELGDGLFGFDRTEAVSWIEDAIVFHGRIAGDPSCLANDIIDVDATGAVNDRLVTHIVLDVTSDVAEVSLAAAQARC